MKPDSSRIDSLLKNPGATPAILLHGPDSGLVAERGAALVKAILGSTDDPFRFAELHAPDPALFLSEATAASMTGGRRVIRIRDAGEALAKPLESLLKTPPDALIILEAGELTPKSKLRALAEKHQTAAAIACYATDAARLPKLITDRLRADGITIDPDAAAWVAANTAPEAGPLRQTLEFLRLYAGSTARLSLEDVRNALPDGGDSSIQDAIDAALTGDPAATDRALALAYDEGVSPVAIIRVLLGELMRLRVAAASGLPASEAVAAMRPPVFFKRTATVIRALSLWSTPALTDAITRALTAEAACKTTHIPDAAYCRQFLLGLASRARVSARR
jgi:DNA polymerase-3 subunit delta